MSRIVDLESQVNGTIRRTYGQDASIWQPTYAETYSITVAFGEPANVEGLDPAYRHMWAVRSDFRSEPAVGDKITTADGSEWTVFGVHGKGGGVWLSVNLT